MAGWCTWNRLSPPFWSLLAHDRYSGNVVTLFHKGTSGLLSPSTNMAEKYKNSARPDKTKSSRVTATEGGHECEGGN